MTGRVEDCSEVVQRYMAFFEQLQPELLGAIDSYFTPDAHFKDPFNNVIGSDAIRRIFEHMFETTEAPSFRIDDWMCKGNSASLRWQFRCRIKGHALIIPGMSFVRFNAQGQAEEHIDYWDPAEGIYEKLPLVGVLMRALRRRLAAAETGQ